jgi:hypothetical protein
VYVANILVNSKAARLEITLDADFLASTALDIVFRHPYTLNTNLHATSQTADVQVQWVAPSVATGDGTIETHMSLYNLGAQTIALGGLVNTFITMRE